MVAIRVKYTMDSRSVQLYGEKLYNKTLSKKNVDHNCSAKNNTYFSRATKKLPNLSIQSIA
jgi:hypothetical protein